MSKFKIQLKKTDFKEGELVKQMSEDDFDLVLAVNLKGVFNCTQAVAPIMIRQGGGVILNATSIVGIDGNLGQTNYVATKAGVIGMTKVWARELGRYNIRVNAVAPGFTATDILTSMPDNVLAGMKARTPLGRLGQPHDIVCLDIIHRTLLYPSLHKVRGLSGFPSPSSQRRWKNHSPL